MRLLSYVALASLPFTASTCRAQSAECNREPVGVISVFLDGAAPRESVTFRARVAAVHQPSDIGIRRYELVDSDGATRVLNWSSPDDGLPIASDREYEFHVEHVAGFPEASAVVIRDEEGLLFAAASDQGVGQLVLKEGLPELELAVIPSECRSRPPGDCYDAMVNAQLEVRHEGSTRRLFHGESAELGAYRISVLTAQNVVYSARCADAGLHALSYTVRRLE